MNPIRCAARAASCGLLALAAFAAQAHITLEYQAAAAGSYYKATFRVMHGCAGSPTRQIVVDVPPGVLGARPMPHPGWNVDVLRENLAQPVTDHGRTVTEDVSRVSWSARTREDFLANAHYDEFVLMARMPSKPGPLYWKVSQVCEQGRTDWAEVPSANQPAGALRYPAAVLEILPAGAGGAHNH